MWTRVVSVQSLADFATDNTGNGFESVQVQASINGERSFTIRSLGQALCDGCGNLTLSPSGTGGGVFLGSGTLQNSRLPSGIHGRGVNGDDRADRYETSSWGRHHSYEPATVAVGLLCVLGAMWHQLTAWFALRVAATPN